MTPIKLKAPLKDYLWGGTRLKTDFGKKTDLEKVAESWELSCHKDGRSVVASGPYPSTLKSTEKEFWGHMAKDFRIFRF